MFDERAIMFYSNTPIHKHGRHELYRTVKHRIQNTQDVDSPTHQVSKVTTLWGCLETNVVHIARDGCLG